MELIFAKLQHLTEITKIEKSFKQIAFSEQQIKRQILKENVMIITKDDEILGYVFINKTGKKTGYITNLIVVKKARRQGLGRELLRFGKAYLALKQCNKISLYVRCTNKEAIKLYESEDFRIIKRIPKLFLKKTDGYLMSCNIS